MNTFGVWAYYTVMRLLFVAVPFAIMFFLLPPGLWFWAINAIVSVTIGLCLSYLLLQKPREQLARALQQRRAARKAERSDVEVEDEASRTEAGRYAPSVGTVLDEHERAARERSHTKRDSE